MSYVNLADITQEAMIEAERLISIQNRRSQPFRNRFDHTMRVLNWAKRIQKLEGGNLEIITLAVLFHDTGWSDTLDHALLGAQLAEKHLKSIDVDPETINRITSAVKAHNKRLDSPSNLPIENLIVMDADFLDEVGVTTLVWDALATAIEDNPSYAKVIEKDLVFFERKKDQAMLLKTKTGKKFFHERMAIWENCLSHLKYELGINEYVK